MRIPPCELPYTLYVCEDPQYMYQSIVSYMEPGVYEQVRTSTRNGAVASRFICDYNSIMDRFLWSSSENINTVEVYRVNCPPEIRWDVDRQDINMNLGARLWGRILAIDDYLHMDPITINPSQFEVSYGIPGGMETNYHYVPPRLDRPFSISPGDAQLGAVYCFIMERRTQ